MYATIDLHFPYPLDKVKLIEKLAASSGIQETIDQTVHSRAPALAKKDAFYANLSSSSAVLFLSGQGEQQCQVHIEHIRARGSIQDLKSQVLLTLQSVLDACKNSKQDADQISITILAEDNRIVVGQKLSLVEHLKKRLRETVIGDLLFAIMPPFAAYIVSGETKTALVTFVSAVLAMAIWLYLEIHGKKNEVIYEDV